MAPLKSFQLLELNIISAQDLQPVSKKMRTYAKAWMHPNRKLSSCVDTEGNNSPTWNDKFVFRVDEEFLRQDTSAVMIEIYAVHWFRDVLVGTVRVLVGNLIPPPTRSHHHSHNHIGMRFVALQVRRPSGRPQGILNIGVALLDGSMRSMPLYTQLSMSAVGYRDLMEDPPSLQQLQQKENLNDDKNNNNNNHQNVKPILRRSRSDRSEHLALDHISPNSSIVGVKGKPEAKESSILSITECMVPINGIRKIGKASSVISGAELREKPKQKGKKGKAGSVLSDSIVSKESSNFRKMEPSNKDEDKNNKANEKPVPDESSDRTANKVVDEKSVTKAKVVNNVDPPKEKLPITTIGKPISKYNGYDYGAPKGSKYVIGAPFKKGNSIWSDSEVGPSPSEVAAVMAEKKYPLDDNQSSVLDGWSLDESVEGLRSKLERWRMELPPLYDRGFSSSSYKSSGHHVRRHTDGGTGLFSCFGNIFGYECQCICGKPPGRKSYGNRFHSPSTLTPGRSFL
ncbi:hypothetical protein CDL12_11705 [Handroanthus impetiginosus]|uniref:C2 domain-containing protein n=1 Tax=Handroanthus impetiginosus TaxID=429701 RepID=A0A2G9HDQ7_9LAMI|nr:hypothetical protein CDL12_11705 [Handroanthus impetiginosus]